MNVVFAGGGTGGHLYPAIALAEALHARGDRVAFVGAADRLESRLVPRAGYTLHTIASHPFARKPSLDALRMVGANARGVLQSARLLRRLQPNLVIASGGYVCFPLVLAAKMLRSSRLLRAPIALIEPNARPGLTNRVLAPLVDEVWGAFADGDARFGGKYVATGIPVRASLRRLPPRSEAVARLGLRPTHKTLLAMGGSQGARTINDALAALVRADGLPNGWQLLHVTGEKEYDRVRAALGKSETSVRPYLDDLSDAYAAADLVLARAGASTLGELAATGKPAMLIPYPHAADDHQTENARRFEAAGAAVVASDRDLVAGKLGNLLSQTIVPARLAAMEAGAARMAGADPVATILARVDTLVARRKA